MDTLDSIPWLLVLPACYWLACVGAACYCSAARDRSMAEGFWFGLLFGPLGVIVAACLPRQRPIRRRPPAIVPRRTGQKGPIFAPWPDPPPKEPEA